MGSSVEINDTPQITSEQGFPQDTLNRDSHIQNPVTAQQLKDRIFELHDKPGARIFQLAPVRVCLVKLPFW